MSFNFKAFHFLNFCPDDKFGKRYEKIKIQFWPKFYSIWNVIMKLNKELITYIVSRFLNVVIYIHSK